MSNMAPGLENNMFMLYCNNVKKNMLIILPLAFKFLLPRRDCFDFERTRDYFGLVYLFYSFIN